MEEVRVAVTASGGQLRKRVARLFDEAPAEWSVRFEEEMLDPGESLSPSVSGRVIAVAGTGGSGTTNVALHLARDLAARRRTIVVDLDVKWRGVAERLGIRGPDVKTWAALPDDPTDLIRTALPVPGGYRALLAPAAPTDTVPGAAIRAALGIAGCVVVDTPPTQLTEALEMAECGVLVFDATVRGARRAAAILERAPELRWALVANHAAPDRGFGSNPWREAIDRSPALTLPFSPALRTAEAKGDLLHPVWTRWGRGVARIAAALEKA